MRSLTATALLILPLLVLVTALIALVAWSRGELGAGSSWGLSLAISLLVPVTGLAMVHLVSIRRRIRRIAAGMRRLQAGDLDVRVTGGAGGGLGDLEAGFNAMVTEVRQSRDSLQDAIDQSTRDLAESLEVIEIHNAEVDQARRRAVEYSRLKSELLANMSHEIRTPMNAIVGFAGLLAKTDLDAGQRDYLRVIQDSADGLVRTVDDVLDFSRLESGRVTLAHDPFGLRDRIEQALVSRRADAHARRLELVGMVYNDVPDRVVGDPARFTQIVNKLLETAIRYADQGEVVLRVMLEAESPTASEIALAVSAPGKPLPLGDRQRLFLATDRDSLTPTRLYGGAGLGLSIAAELASAMGGRVENEQGAAEGKLFRVVLTLEKDPDAAPPPLPRPLQRRCLLLEPHPVSRRVLTNSLEGLGLAVDADEGLPEPGGLDLGRYAMVALASAGDPASVAAAVDWIERARSLRELPVMVLVSSSDPAVMETFAALDVAACLGKPARRADLEDGTRRCLGMPGRAADGPSADAATASAPPLQGRTILAADDHPVNLRLIRLLLEGLGAKVLVAEDGLEAVEIARATPIDCAILDVHMPRMNGLEAAQALRGLDRKSPVPVVALTADAAERNLHDVRRAGIAAALTKPVDEALLCKTLLSVLDGDRPVDTLPPPLGPPPGPADDALPVRDRAQALRVAGGSESIAAKLFDEFCRDLPDAIDGMGQSHQTRNWEELWQQAHRLVGAARVCGTPALHRSLERLQPVVSLGDEAAIGPALERVRAEATRVLDGRGDA